MSEGWMKYSITLNENYMQRMKIDFLLFRIRQYYNEKHQVKLVGKISSENYF